MIRCRSPANRRFAHGFQFTGAYTWAGGTSNGWYQNNPLPSIVARQRNTLVQKEAAVFTYTWDLPRGSRLMPGKVSQSRSSTAGSSRASRPSPPARSRTSAPAPPTASTSPAAAKAAGHSCRPAMPSCRAASADRRSMVQHCRLPAPRRPRRHRQQLQQRASSSSPASTTTTSRSSRPSSSPSGRRCSSGGRRSTRFNHTQFSTIGTTAQWSATGAQTNSTFGKATAARDGRKMMFGLKFQF